MAEHFPGSGREICPGSGTVVKKTIPCSWDHQDAICPECGARVGHLSTFGLFAHVRGGTHEPETWEQAEARTKKAPTP